jgi:YD repeat-containing protein
MAYANPDAVTSIGSATVAYDNAGNETSSGSNTFTWDWRGQLNTSHIAATSSTYSYDENDKRTRIDDGLTVFYYPKCAVRRFGRDADRRLGREQRDAGPRH